MLAFLSWSCIEPEAGETGFYASPCAGTFSDILQCRSDTGGTDPESDVEPGDDVGPFTCADACQQFAECGLLDTTEVGECTSSCLSDDDVNQILLDCIRDNGCNVNACFG